MALVIATICFVGFVGEVILGAFAGISVLSDVQEALVLFLGSVAFVAEILRREARAKDGS